MDLSHLAELGKYAGIGGIAIGAVILIVSSIINQTPSLPRGERAPILRLLAIGAFAVGVLGIVAWQANAGLSGQHASTRGKDFACRDRERKRNDRPRRFSRRLRANASIWRAAQCDGENRGRIDRLRSSRAGMPWSRRETDPRNQSRNKDRRDVRRKKLRSGGSLDRARRRQRFAGGAARRNTRRRKSGCDRFARTSLIIYGFKAKEVQDLMTAVVAGVVDPLADKIVDLSNRLGVTQDQTLTILKILGQKDVAIEQLVQKLAEVAVQFKGLDDFGKVQPLKFSGNIPMLVRKVKASRDCNCSPSGGYVDCTRGAPASVRRMASRAPMARRRAVSTTDRMSA